MSGRERKYRYDIPYSVAGHTFHVFNSFEFEIDHIGVTLSEGGMGNFIFQLVQPSLMVLKADKFRTLEPILVDLNGERLDMNNNV